MTADREEALEADERPAGSVRDTPAAYDVARSSEAFTSERVIDVRTDEVRMPSGDLVTRDVVLHPGAVGVIALDEQGRVLVVEQYRHPVRHKLWEPPAGLLDADAAGETARETAERELYEETGYRATDWRVLVDLFTSPGMSDEALRIFLARGLSRVPEAERHAGSHEEADMPISWVPVADAVDKLLAGELHNPIAAAGILAVAAALARPGGADALRPADAPWPQRKG